MVLQAELPPPTTRFSWPLAIGWTALVTSGLWLALTALFLLFGRSANDIVLLGLTQVAVYAIVIAAFGYALGTPVRELLALRRASPVVCLSAAALGAALQVPATLLSDLVEHFFPTPPAELSARLARITPHSLAHGIAIFVIVAGLGPCVEELFFRGALFGALRRSHSALGTIAVVSLCFVLGHLDLRLFLPLLVAAVALGQIRERTASLWPGLALHAAFNATTLSYVFSGAATPGSPPAFPLLAALTGCTLSILLVLLIHRLTPPQRRSA
jgi:membrane protease YdiL (CAAX protease family)